MAESRATGHGERGASHEQGRRSRARDVAPSAVLALLDEGRESEAHALLRSAFDPAVDPAASDLAESCRGLRALSSAEDALRSGRITDLVSEATIATACVPRSAPWLRFRCGSVLQACYRFTGEARDRERAIQLLARAADRLDLPELAVTARGLLGNVHLLSGAFHAAYDHCDSGIALARSSGLADAPAVAMAHQFRGYVLFEWNRLSEAETSLREAWRVAGDPGRGVRSGTARLLGEVAAARGDPRGAKAWLARLEEIVAEPMTLRNREWLSAVRMGRTLGSGDLRAIREWLHAYDYRAVTVAAMSPAQVRARLHELSEVLDLLEAIEQWDELLGVAQPLARATVDARRWFGARALAAVAVAHEASGRHEEADRAQADALAQGELGSLVRVYLGRSPFRRTVLVRAARGASAERAGRVLRALHDDGRAAGAPLLTPRQTAVLRHVARGDSNKAIARRMGLSVNTVRAHLRTIFERLDASSRTEAVARAREAGLPVDPDNPRHS